MYLIMKSNIITQPIFLTKEQRVAEALKRRQEEIDNLRKKQDVERKIVEEIQKGRMEEVYKEDRDHR